MIIKTFVEPPLDNNNYIIIDESTMEAALIDCSSTDIWNKVPYSKGRVAASLVGENRQVVDNVELKYILLTHGHFDHIAGIGQNVSAENLSEGSVYPKVYMHKADLGWVSRVNECMSMFDMPQIKVPQIDAFIDDGDIIKLGNTDIKVIHTPGHTQGGVCYYVNNVLFSGDTLFRETVGRCDLTGGDFDQIVSSIENKLYKLPDDTVVYPGHGKSTTIGWEKTHNSYM